MRARKGPLEHDNNEHLHIKYNSILPCFPNFQAFHVFFRRGAPVVRARFRRALPQGLLPGRYNYFFIMNAVPRDGQPSSWTGTVFALLAVICTAAFIAAAGCTTSPGARAGDTVQVYYSVAFPGGQPFESNQNGTPLEFTVGTGSVIKGFNQAVVGMIPGENRTVTLSPDQAYGNRNESLVMTLPTEQVKELTDNLQKQGSLVVRVFPGMDEPVFEYHLPNNVIQYVTLTNITAGTTHVDFNHPLAGKDLVFTITLKEIVKRAAAG